MGYLYLWKAVGAAGGAAGAGKARLWALGAACTIAIVPFTILFMRGNIDGLEKAGEVTPSSSTATTTVSSTIPTTTPTINIVGVEDDAEKAGVEGAAVTAEEQIPIPGHKPSKEDVDAARRISAMEEAKSVRKLVDEWGMFNLGRAALTGTGFVVGLWAGLT